MQKFYPRHGKTCYFKKRKPQNILNVLLYLRVKIDLFISVLLPPPFPLLKFKNELDSRGSCRLSFRGVIPTPPLNWAKTHVIHHEN